MATLTLQLISPQGYPLQLALQPDDDGEKIKILLQRAETLGVDDNKWLELRRRPGQPAPGQRTGSRADLRRLPVQPNC